MTRGASDTQARTIKSRTKVKTGCLTCRVRKVKCDEQKPSCQKCVGTGRTCDGYESPFRNATNESIGKTHAARTKFGLGLPLAQPGLLEIAPEDIERLNRSFSIKTMLDVKLGCGDEARQLLEASMTDPVIRHAITSLRTLRDDLDNSGTGLTATTESIPGYGRGLEQYTKALGGLSSDISSPDVEKIKSALLCCQIFISIEQLLGNYDAMAQHIIQGLGILHESRARPSITAEDTLLPAHPGQLPYLDVFIVKLFAAPCKFTDPPSKDATELQSPGSDTSSHRAIAPNMRTALTKISESVIEFLAQVSSLSSKDQAKDLQHKKTALLKSLNSWLADHNLAQVGAAYIEAETITSLFLRFFYHVQKIVLLGTLDSAPPTVAALRTEKDQLQAVANVVGARVRDYKIGKTD